MGCTAFWGIREPPAGHFTGHSHHNSFHSLTNAATSRHGLKDIQIQTFSACCLHKQVDFALSGSFTQGVKCKIGRIAPPPPSCYTLIARLSRCCLHLQCAHTEADSPDGPQHTRRHPTLNTTHAHHTGTHPAAMATPQLPQAQLGLLKWACSRPPPPRWRQPNYPHEPGRPILSHTTHTRSSAALATLLTSRGVLSTGPCLSAWR